MNICGVCYNSEPGTHCFRWVNRKGQTGYAGCHNHFSSEEAWKLHVAKTGGCHDPENVPQLKWDGVSWGVKEREEARTHSSH
jgi:hypothetical protein